MARLTLGAYRARHALATAVTWCSGDEQRSASHGRGRLSRYVTASAPCPGRTTRRATARRSTASASVRG
jgi:hypothetical protein